MIEVLDVDPARRCIAQFFDELRPNGPRPAATGWLRELESIVSLTVEGHLQEQGPVHSSIRTKALQAQPLVTCVRNHGFCEFAARLSCL